MTQPFDVRKSDKPFDQNRTLVAVIELSQASWLVGGMVPGLKRSPLKKLEPKKEKLLELLVRWRDEALRAGHEIKRIAVACESGRDGFWLATRRAWSLQHGDDPQLRGGGRQAPEPRARVPCEGTHAPDQ